MAVKKEIIVTISQDGEIQMETRGMKGAECEEEIKPIAKDLGPIKSIKKTSEYYEKPKQKNKIGSSTK